MEPLGFHYTKTNGWTRHSWILGIGRAGWGWWGQAISLLSGSMPQVACKHAMRRPSERRCTTKEIAHLFSFGNCKLWQRIRAGNVDFSSMATIDVEGKNTTMTISFFPSHRWFLAWGQTKIHQMSAGFLPKWLLEWKVYRSRADLPAWSWL